MEAKEINNVTFSGFMLFWWWRSLLEMFHFFMLKIKIFCVFGKLMIKNNPERVIGL